MKMVLFKLYLLCISIQLLVTIKPIADMASSIAIDISIQLLVTIKLSVLPTGKAFKGISIQLLVTIKLQVIKLQTIYYSNFNTTTCYY